MNKKKAKGAKFQNKKRFKPKWDAVKASEILGVSPEQAESIHNVIYAGSKLAKGE